MEYNKVTTPYRPTPGEMGPSHESRTEKIRCSYCLCCDATRSPDLELYDQCFDDLGPYMRGQLREYRKDNPGSN